MALLLDIFGHGVMSNSSCGDDVAVDYASATWVNDLSVLPIRLVTQPRMRVLSPTGDGIHIAFIGREASMRSQYLNMAYWATTGFWRSPSPVNERMFAHDTQAYNGSVFLGYRTSWLQYFATTTARLEGKENCAMCAGPESLFPELRTYYNDVNRIRLTYSASAANVQMADVVVTSDAECEKIFTHGRLVWRTPFPNNYVWDDETEKIRNNRSVPVGPRWTVLDAAAVVEGLLPLFRLGQSSRFWDGVVIGSALYAALNQLLLEMV